MALWLKRPTPRDRMLCIGLNWGNIENRIFSETTRPIALIFGMLQNLVRLNQVCSNYNPMVKNGTIFRGRMFCKGLF